MLQRRGHGQDRGEEWEHGTTTNYYVVVAYNDYDTWFSQCSTASSSADKNNNRANQHQIYIMEMDRCAYAYDTYLDQFDVCLFTPFRSNCKMKKTTRNIFSIKAFIIQYKDQTFVSPKTKNTNKQKD